MRSCGRSLETQEDEQNGEKDEIKNIRTINEEDMEGDIKIKRR
jgi:hypothetical protein